MRRPWVLSTLMLLCLAAASGCSGLRTSNERSATPITLSYPYGESGAQLFDGYRRVADDAARSYVVVTILADPETAAEAGKELVNAASGTVVDKAGLIVTASHIAIDPKYRARVRMMDGSVIEGTVVDVDRDRELALIKVPPNRGLVPARFADSSSLEKGDHAIAIGSPDNTDGVVSLGVVEDPRYSKPIAYNGYTIVDPVILSMKVDFGNSGGPVVNEHGELIGMIAGVDLYKPAIAFAVPSNVIVNYLDDIAARN
jgi:S1-C subfamily serine protease